MYVSADLPVPHWVGGVGYDGGASLLAVVGELGEAAPLPRLNGHLQVGVGVEEHALLQARRPDVWWWMENTQSSAHFFLLDYSHATVPQTRSSHLIG